MKQMRNPKFTNRRRFQNRFDAGFSLIEVMISVTIGLVILGGLVTVLSTSASNSKTNDRTSELMTNGRYALDSIKQELRQAGFRGYTFATPSTPSTNLGTFAGECLESGEAAGSFVINIKQSVWGANDTNPFSSNCIPTANFASLNDVLVIRRVASLPSTTYAAGAIYFRSSYVVGELFRGTTFPTINFSVGLVPLADFALQTYVYYISPFTNSATESPLVPALYRVALTNSGAMQAELVASGIEHMQVQYGRVTTAPSTQYFDSIVGSSSTTSATGWDDVTSVRVWLLARNSTTEAGYIDPNVYQLGDQTYTPNDNYRRQVFSTVVQLRNKQ